MRRTMVNRSVLVLSVVFVGACIAFALAVEPGPQSAPGSDEAPGARAPRADAAAGARLYELRCDRCHTLEESLAPLREAEPGADARADYVAMLQRHRKSSADEHAPIADYLQSRLDNVDAPPGMPEPD